MQRLILLTHLTIILHLHQSIWWRCFFFRENYTNSVV